MKRGERERRKKKKKKKKGGGVEIFSREDGKFRGSWFWFGLIRRNELSGLEWGRVEENKLLSTSATLYETFFTSIGFYLLQGRVSSFVDGPGFIVSLPNCA